MKIIKFQEGGGVPAEQAQPSAAGNEEVMQQLYQMAQQIIEQIGPEAAAMLAQAIMELLQGGQEQLGAAPEEQQFMRCGGKLKKAKKACGGKMKKSR